MHVLPAVALCCLCAQAEPSDPHTIEGSTAPPQELEIVATLDDFSSPQPANWKTQGGSNMEHEFSCGVKLAQLNMPLGRWRTRRKDETVLEPGANWVSASRTFSPERKWAGAEALRVTLASARELEIWMECSLETPSGTYKQVIDPRRYPARLFQDRVLYFKDFEGPGPLDPTQIERITFVAYGHTNNLYFAGLELVRKVRLDGWLEFETSAKTNHLFERGAPVELVFKPRGTPPKGCTGFRYRITNFFGELVQEGNCPLSQLQQMRLEGLAPGYYEVRAWWTGGAGPEFQKPIIKEPGTMPPGMSTFAVMPRTVDENKSDASQESFFGLHWGVLEQPEFIGTSWILDCHYWNDLEGKGRPARSGGPADWAKAILAGPPQPTWRFGILNFRTNLLGEIPAWARKADKTFPGWHDWADYEAFVRDCVLVHKHLFRHMKKRPIDLMWEVDLNMPPHNFDPPWRPEQVVELYRRMRPIIKELDPDAELLGPCPSGIAVGMTWWKPFLEGGLTKYIDGISLHMYHESPPERSGLVEHIRELKAAIRKASGKDLPIYTTEWGFISEVGSAHRLRETAEVTVRSNIIAQGEGLRASLVFYAYDYKPSWGIAFNLDPDFERRRWGPPRIAPKPATSALATQVAVLGKARPAGRVEGLGDDVWCYRFETATHTIWAIWTPGEARKVALQVGRSRSVELIDIMGRLSTRPVEKGLVQLEISPSVLYVRAARR